MSIAARGRGVECIVCVVYVCGEWRRKRGAAAQGLIAGKSGAVYKIGDEALAAQCANERGPSRARRQGRA